MVLSLGVLSRVYVLPVLHVTVALGSLCAKVDQVATEEEVVPGSDGHGVAHEGGAVADKSGGHGAGNAVVEVLVSLAFSHGRGPAQARAVFQRHR